MRLQRVLGNAGCGVSYLRNMRQQADAEAGAEGNCGLGRSRQTQRAAHGVAHLAQDDR